MVNFRDPAVIAQDSLAMTKLEYILSGLYVWEFLTTLYFEWNVIRGYRPYRWTIWIYSTTRLATLLTIIVSFVTPNITSHATCKVQTIFRFILPYVAFAAASLLIVLRVIAIWNWKKLVIAIATGVWVANVGFLIQSVVRIRATWDPLLAACIITNIHSTKLNLITNLITDVVLLLIMLIGLLRLGFYEPGLYGIGYLMWKQGLVWFFIATIIEIPPVVFISLDLNGPLVLMFPVATVTLSIAATRIYHTLVEFSFNSVGVCDNFHSSLSAAASRGKRVPDQTISLEPVEVAVNRTYDQSQTTNQQVVFISSEGVMHEQTAGLGPDYDVERIAESRIRAP